MKPTVLFVSKPIVPPFHDGSICLVAEIAKNIPHYQAVVLSTSEGPSLAPGIELDRTYARRGKFAPGLIDNARVVLRLIGGRRNDLWHFVFAPNPKSSKVGALAKAVRKVPVVQTVASRPKDFKDSARLLFGDRIVTVSKHTADQLIRSGAKTGRIDIIPPPIADLTRSQGQRDRARIDLGIAKGVPLFCYPGDLEFSTGAQTSARAVPEILARIPDAHVVFACRAKTPKAHHAHAILKEQLGKHGEKVHFLGEVADLPALLGASTAVLFPVDDLYGKVDLPFAVLEACLLAVPVIVANGGPLTEIEGALSIEPGDYEALARTSLELAGSESMGRQVGEALRRHVREKHDPVRIGAAYEEVYARCL